MMKLHGHPKFYELLEEIKHLHSNKNADYAEPDNPLSNFKACEKIKIPCPHCKELIRIPAWIGVLVRMQDKWDRIIHLIAKEPSVVGEGIIDTLKDNSVYSLIDIVLFLEEQERKNS